MMYQKAKAAVIDFKGIEFLWHPALSGERLWRTFAICAVTAILIIWRPVILHACSSADPRDKRFTRSLEILRVAPSTPMKLAAPAGIAEFINQHQIMLCYMV